MFLSLSPCSNGVSQRNEHVDIPDVIAWDRMHSRQSVRLPVLCTDRRLQIFVHLGYIHCVTSAGSWLLGYL